MKFTKKFYGVFTLLQVLLVCAVIALIAAVAIPKAHADIYSSVITGDAINGPLLQDATSTNQAAANVNRIVLQKGKGIAFFPRYVGMGSTNTGLSCALFAVAGDVYGTNFTTTAPIPVPITGNGTTAGRDFVYIPPTTLGPATALKLLTITNAAANNHGLIISNLTYVIENPQ